MLKNNCCFWCSWVINCNLLLIAYSIKCLTQSLNIILVWQQRKHILNLSRVLFTVVSAKFFVLVTFWSFFFFIICNHPVNVPLLMEAALIHNTFKVTDWQDMLKIKGAVWPIFGPVFHPKFIYITKFHSIGLTLSSGGKDRQGMYFGGPIRKNQRASPVTGSLALGFSCTFLVYYCNR